MYLVLAHPDANTLSTQSTSTDMFFFFCFADLVAAKDFGVSQQKAVADVEEKKNTIVKGLQDEIVTLKQQCPPPKQDSDPAVK